MKPILFTTLFILGTISSSFSQNKPAYVLYNSKGKKVSFNKLLKDATKSNVVLFGELHDNPIAHWLQLELTKELGKNNKLILGAEMFEKRQSRWTERLFEQFDYWEGVGFIGEIMDQLSNGLRSTR